jgi:hypothetical protein
MQLEACFCHRLLERERRVAGWSIGAREATTALAFDGDHVTFAYKHYAHSDARCTMTLTAMEFLRRFVQHILPRGFVRIRQSGFLANACCTSRVARPGPSSRHLPRRRPRQNRPHPPPRTHPPARRGRVHGAARR